MSSSVPEAAGVGEYLLGPLAVDVLELLDVVVFAALWGAPKAPMDGCASSSGASSTIRQLRREPCCDPLSEPCREPFGDVSKFWLACKESDDLCPDMRRLMLAKAEGLLLPEGLLEGPVLRLNPDGLLTLT